MFKLKTYHSLEEVLLLKKQTTNEKELHVFGTGSVSTSVSKGFQINATSIDEITRILFPNFRTVKSEIYLQSILRKEIMSGEYYYKNYLLNRLSELVRTFTLFTELNVNQLTFISDDPRKMEIIRLMNHLMLDKLLKSFHQRKNDLTKDDISMALCGHLHLNKIYIYEIEYLNFLRMNLIHWLRNRGFQIEFHVPFDKKLPNTFLFWKNVYDVVIQSDITDCQTIVNKKDENRYGQRFGSFNENILNVDVKDRENVESLEFNSPADFTHYYHANQENMLAISPKDVNKIVQNIKSECYENNLGKFVYYIKYCEIKSGEIYLDYETLVELITSEWVYTPNVNGKDALSFLIDLRDYMYGVKTTADVIDRLKSLQKLDNISKTIDKENSNDTDKNYFKRYMLNPFRTFNYTHSERYSVTINQLIDLVEQLEKIAHHLILEEEQTLNVNEYFSRWLKILANIPDSDRKQFWKSVFEETVQDEWNFAIEELLSLIYLLASNKSSEEKTIYDISRLQEFTLLQNHNKTLHLTNITQLSFPENHKTTITHFFSYSELKEIINGTTDKKQRAIALHSLWVDHTVVENFSQLGSYQLFNILAYYTGPLVFSWIKNLNEKDMRSVYLDILDDLYGKEGIKEYSINETFLFEKDIPPQQHPITIDFDKIKGKIPELYWLDHDFCSKKFLLTTFIDKQPVYSSEFHQQFIFSKIGKLFTSSKSEQQEFRELIYPLFPLWTYTKKENLIDTEYKTELRNYKHFENITYPKEMRGFQVLRSIYRENRRTKARNQYRKDRNSNESALLKTFRENMEQNGVTAEPGNHCKMCPFLNSCSEGAYSIDNFS